MRYVPDELEPLGEWEFVAAFQDENAALTLAGKLRSSDCPTKVSPRKLASALESEFCIFVPRSLLHRARWIQAQLPISDEELESLAMRSRNKAPE